MAWDFSTDEGSFDTRRLVAICVYYSFLTNTNEDKCGINIFLHSFQERMFLERIKLGLILVRTNNEYYTLLSDINPIQVFVWQKFNSRWNYLSFLTYQTYYLSLISHMQNCKVFKSVSSKISETVGLELAVKNP